LTVSDQFQALAASSWAKELITHWIGS